jgi:hypothetical protein
VSGRHAGRLKLATKSNIEFITLLTTFGANNKILNVGMYRIPNSTGHRRNEMIKIVLRWLRGEYSLVATSEKIRSGYSQGKSDSSTKPTWYKV